MKNKRYEIHDSLGYLNSYNSRRRAEQAIHDINNMSQQTKYDCGISLFKGFYYIKDILDLKSISIFKIE